MFLLHFFDKNKKSCQSRIYVLSIGCLFMPKIILKIPFKNLGPLKITTFTTKPPLAFVTGTSENNYPECKYRYQKFRRTETRNQHTARKSYCGKTFIKIKAFSHFVSPLQYIIWEKRKKLPILFFSSFPRL